MKKNTSWKFTDKSSVTFQSSVSGPGEFGLTRDPSLLLQLHKYNCAVCLWTPLQPPCRESTKVFPGNFLDEVPSYAQQQLDVGPSTKSVRKDLDHVVNKIPWTKDGIIIIPSWKYATILYFNFYILTK